MADALIDKELFDVEEIIKYYFFRGFSYDEICMFLQRKYAIEISISTLKSRIKSYSLRRKQVDYDIAQVREAIVSIVNGHDSLQG